MIVNPSRHRRHHAHASHAPLDFGSACGPVPNQPAVCERPKKRSNRYWSEFEGKGSVLGGSWVWRESASVDDGTVPASCIWSASKAVWFISHAEIFYGHRHRDGLTERHALVDRRLIASLSSDAAPCVCDNTDVAPCRDEQLEADGDV